MSTRVVEAYQELVAVGEIRADAAQEKLGKELDVVAQVERETEEEPECESGGQRERERKREILSHRIHQPSQFEQTDGFNTPSFETCNWT